MSEQNGISEILNSNPVIPVATINSLNEVDEIYNKLKEQNINCIEITLRTEVAWEAVNLFKLKYNDIAVGVGTVTDVTHVHNGVDNKVDFIVSPGLTPHLVQSLEHSKIPFLPGVCTPSEIMYGMHLGWNYFKFFPANLYGGIEALKTFNQVFNKVKFCPTGGINRENFNEFLELENVISVGGSWILK